MLDIYNTETSVVFSFDGKLESAVCKELDQVIPARLETVDFPVVFDLGQVDFISSAFIRICFATAKNPVVKEFSIINTSPNIKKVFKIAGVDSVIKIV